MTDPASKTMEDTESPVTGPWRTLDGNEAVASVAYRLSDLIAIYPITPASAMGEHADDWASLQRPNLWGEVPTVVEMQSEAGAAGTVHGALQAGACVTTFTASQGLLLMLPNLYKIAGELTPFCMHVAARSVATHALSIFGDHSDVMAARGTGFALLASGSVQEAQDLAAIGHAVSLEARVPVLHFFDGFRTSHEMAKIRTLDDEVLRALLSAAALQAHRDRRLTPDHPVVRGTSQNPDTFFSSREAINPAYAGFADRLQQVMDCFGRLTGRHYHPFDYAGHPEAEWVIVLMGSGAECTHETVDWLVGRGERVGVLKVRLMRPFSARHFFAALPPTVQAIAVLDRCKEPGSAGEPLLTEVSTAFMKGWSEGTCQSLPRLAGGRYGLSSREFTPGMVAAIFAHLRDPASRTEFTVGIEDDVSHLSLPWDETLDIEAPEVRRAVFFGLGADGTVSSNKNSIRIIGEHPQGARISSKSERDNGSTDNGTGIPAARSADQEGLFVQGYFVYDSKKSGSTTVSHLRFGPRPIRSSYLIRKAHFVAIHDPRLLDRVEVVEHLDEGGTLLLNTPWPLAEIWDRLTLPVQHSLLRSSARIYAIDAESVAEKAGLGRRINTVMQVCFLALAKVLPAAEAVERVRDSIRETWGKRGPEIVKRNLLAVDAALESLREVDPPTRLSSSRQPRPGIGNDAPKFVRRITAELLEGRGEGLPVSAFPVDGTWPSGTSQYEKRGIAQTIPIWEPDLCVQCNRCAMICPHSAIRVKVIEPDHLQGRPADFVTVAEAYTPELQGLQYRVQVAPEDCTGCGLCVAVCPARDRTQPRRLALNMRPVEDHREREAAHLDYFRHLPELPPSRIPTDTRSLILRQPLFEFSGACSGCGETPYIRLLTQLLGDRLLLANATGCSSIYGGNLPTTPYTIDAAGRGPAWNNSLFEDAAEMGLGLRLGADRLQRHALRCLRELADWLPAPLVAALQAPCASTDEAAVEQRRRDIATLRARLAEVLAEVLAVVLAERLATPLGASPPASASPPPTPALAGTLPDVRRDVDPARATPLHDREAVCRVARELLALADELGPRSVWVIGGDGWAYDIGYGGLDHVLASGQPVKMLVLDTEVYSNTGGQQSKATPLGATAKFAAAGKDIAKKDLGLLAMSYGHVYVAQIALQSHHNHAAQALLEAERYPGPALVIAQCPCIAHGYDLLHSPQQQRQAVDSWAWPIYRFDPRRLAEGLPPLQLDHPRQTRTVRAYMEEEARFRMVALRDPERYETLVKAATQATAERRSLYLQLARIHLDGATEAEQTKAPPSRGVPS